MTSTLQQNLQPLLEETLESCSYEQRLHEDPVGLVRAYSRPEDREVAGLFASGLAYGRVELVRAAIREALNPLGAHPADRLRTIDDDELDRLWPDFVYRMTRGADLRDLAAAVRTTLRREGRLQKLYIGDHRDDLPVDDIQGHLACASRFVKKLRERRRRDELARGFRYLLVNPEDGSACKRLHLFFRWMIRGPGPVDMGVWDRVSPSALVMPLDTHTSRLCRYLGLLKRKSVDAKAAVEVSMKLAQFDSDDPLRYDFALCHLGISKRCIHRRCPDRCPKCPIEPACTLS